LVAVVTLATVLEECATEEQRSVVRFLESKGLHTKDIYKDLFYVYDRKCFLRKAVHNCFEKFSQGRWKVVYDVRPVEEVIETRVKRLLCCRFRRTVNAMVLVYEVGEGYVEK
jgi:hypothetical protein